MIKTEKEGALSMNFFANGEMDGIQRPKIIAATDNYAALQNTAKYTLQHFLQLVELITSSSLCK